MNEPWLPPDQPLSISALYNSAAAAAAATTREERPTFAPFVHIIRYPEKLPRIGHGLALDMVVKKWRLGTAPPFKKTLDPATRLHRA